MKFAIGRSSQWYCRVGTKGIAVIRFSSTYGRGFVGVALLLLIISGCSGRQRPERVKVSGRVLLDGQPLETGTIQVLPENARPSYGVLGPDGRFVLSCFDDADGCVIGKHRVVVVADEGVDISTRRWLAPPKYAKPSTSGLEVEISKPTDSLEIKLTWDGKKPFEEPYRP